MQKFTQNVSDLNAEAKTIQLLEDELIFLENTLLVSVIKPT
jgi:hypothetical protein